MKNNKTNIIAISGKLGSGKDTIGQIIQWLTYEDVKNPIDPPITFKEWVKELYTDYNEFGEWQIKKMAGKLKEIASVILGVPVEKFENRGFKESYLSEEWNYVDKHGFKKQMTVREFLQKIGTDAMRNGLHENVWANAFWANYRTNFEAKNAEEWEKDLIQKWIITDVRFPNEAQSIKERDGLMIRVNRFKTLSKKFTSEDGLQSTQMIELDYSKEHPSETGLDDYQDFDYVIENNGTIEDLIEKVREILIKENII